MRLPLGQCVCRWIMRLPLGWHLLLDFLKNPRGSSEKSKGVFANITRAGLQSKKARPQPTHLKPGLRWVGRGRHLLACLFSQLAPNIIGNLFEFFLDIAEQVSANLFAFVWKGPQWYCVRLFRTAHKEWVDICLFLLDAPNRFWQSLYILLDDPQGFGNFVKPFRLPFRFVSFTFRLHFVAFRYETKRNVT